MAPGSPADEAEPQTAPWPWRPLAPRPEVAPTPGLYVHVPFCSAICPYCDFAVVRERPGESERFVEAVLAEAASWPIAPEAPPFDTVYFGGGTPSALGFEQLERLVVGLGRRLPIAPGGEWSLEANPEDVRGSETLAAWRDLGFAVLSLGVQSLDDATLRDLGRRHDRVAALAAARLAAATGFDRVSADLIYATGGRPLDSWREELREAAALGLDHLSCYELTYHRGTAFERERRLGRRRMLDEDARAEWFEATHETLASQGFEAYEVSNFATAPRHQARHNSKYWSHQPYLGLGPSAHSFDGAVRWSNVRSPRRWLERLQSRSVTGGRAAGGEDLPPAVAELERLDLEQLLLEAVSLGLRTRAGLDLVSLRERFAVDLLAASGETVRRHREAGLLELVGEPGRPWLRASLRGWLVSESLTLDLVP
ncbi:MAG: coproporphyrinogen III oxidase family protein [Acidobacteria bacterium]|nr:MAG: coproporphyrinogen III oxidase family protein [Acidobacteriota bacterium]